MLSKNGEKIHSCFENDHRFRKLQPKTSIYMLKAEGPTRLTFELCYGFHL